MSRPSVNIRAALYENVRLGRMEVYVDDHGKEKFRLTDKGKKWARNTKRRNDASS